MFESLCLGQVLLAGILVGAFLIAGCIIKPAPIITPMSPIEESKYDTIITDANGKTTIAQMKEVTNGCKCPEEISQHQITQRQTA